MHGEPIDLFEDMDEMFARLFMRIDRNFMNGFPQESGCRIMVRHAAGSRDEMEMADDAAPVSRTQREPVAEVHRIGSEVKVNVELSGLSDEELRLAVKGNILLIDAGDADHHVRTSATLPPVDTASMQSTLKNGVLEVTFTSIPDSGKE
jgi:HSP20 family molecular chaperone IbpA